MTRRRMRRARDEAGAYAILYALLTLVLVGMSAFVVDLALMRESRASARSATDSAVVAAASALNPLDPSKTDPAEACVSAWRYLRAGIEGLGDGSSTCSGFPAAPVTCNAMTTPTTARWESDKYVVQVTWPVPRTSTLMTDPDVAPGSVTQATNAVFDGINPCDRVAVEVLHTRPTVFAGVLGLEEATTRSASVARAIQQGESKDVVAALNILEQTECQALVTSGQGSVQVNGVDDQAGFIAVESDGHSTGNTCNGQAATIAAATNGLNFIRADGPNGEVGGGLIQSYALNPSPTGNPSKAYNSGPIDPTPTVLGERYGAEPVLDIFNCTDGTCSAGGSDWIDQLEAKYGGSGPPAVPWSTGASWGEFKTLPSAEVPEFTCNGNASTPPIVVPAGNWFVDCPGGLKVAGLVAFRGGHVVTSGPVELGSNTACLAVNVPVDPASPSPTCPTADKAADPDTTSPAPATDSILYIRTGRLYKVSQAQLYLPRTFTYLGNGNTDLAGGSGALLMTTPDPDPATCDTAECKNEHFQKLVLWSEGSAEHGIGGQTDLVLRGVLFTPNAPSTFTGQAGQQQADAQFWTRTLEVKGQGTLVMAADPDASISRPLLGVSLIR